MIKRRCKAITEKGERCRYGAVIVGYCIIHFRQLDNNKKKKKKKTISSS